MQRPANKSDTATSSSEELSPLQKKQNELIAHLSAEAQKPQEGQTNLFSIFSHHNVRTLIFRHLDMPAALRAKCVSRRFQDALNSNWLTDFIARELLPNYVLTANWQELEKLINWNPEVMFKQFTVTILPGFTLQTCVLGYACYMRDRYLLNICKADLKEEQRERYKEIVLAYTIKDELMTLEKIQAHDGYQIFMVLVARWLKKEVGIKDLLDYLVKTTIEMSETNKVYCMQPFYWTCAAYLELYERWTNDQITDEQLNEFWLKIESYVKRFLAPRNMRLQMQARENEAGQHHWAEDAKFDEASYPTDCHVLASGYSGDVDINPESDAYPDAGPDDIFGENYNIARGEGRGAWAVTAGRIIGWLTLDLATFCHLEDVRNKEFIREQTELDPEKRSTPSP